MNTNAPIICGVDGSRGSCVAARTAKALAEQLRCGLVLVHVLPPRPPMPLAAVPVAGHPVGTAQMAELNQLESEAAFASVSDDLADTDAEHVIEHGHAADRLSAVAGDARREADRGRNPRHGPGAVGAPGLGLTRARRRRVPARARRARPGAAPN